VAPTALCVSASLSPCVVYGGAGHLPDDEYLALVLEDNERHAASGGGHRTCSAMMNVVNQLDGFCVVSNEGQYQLFTQERASEMTDQRLLATLVCATSRISAARSLRWMRSRAP
jgi:hypothetical protein